MFGLFHELPQCFAFQCSGPLPTNTFFPLHFSCYFPFTILHPRVVPCTLVCAPVPSCSPAPWCNSLRPCAPCCILVLCCLLILPCAQSCALLHNRQSCMCPPAPLRSFVHLCPPVPLRQYRVPSCTLACALLRHRVPSCTRVWSPAPSSSLAHPVPSCNIVCPPAPLRTLIHPHVPFCTLIYPRGPRAHSLVSFLIPAYASPSRFSYATSSSGVEERA